jgi:hypothetical protein
MNIREITQQEFNTYGKIMDEISYKNNICTVFIRENWTLCGGTFPVVRDNSTFKYYKITLSHYHHTTLRSNFINDLAKLCNDVPELDVLTALEVLAL